jgi:rhamnosyltransferase
MSSVAAVVVTYFPGPVVLDNMRRLSEEIDQVFVVDNGSGGASSNVVEAVEKLPGFKVIRNPSNLGIATALNIGIREALKTGAEWIANFDQDSAITKNYFKELFHAYEICPEANRVGMIVPRGWSTTVAKVMQIGTPVWAFVMGAHTSGCLIKSEIIGQVGLYDDDLFIDFVDMDYCLRLKKQGYKILRAMQVVLHHELGSKQTRKLLGLEISFRDHMPWRYYYMTRNRLLLFRRFYLVSPRWVCVAIVFFLYELAQLCIEPDRGKKIRAMWSGFCDALRNRSGRHPQFPASVT